MNTIAISSSLKYRELIRKAISDLEEIGVTALFPNLDGEVSKEDLDIDLMKKLEADHFEAIESSECLYVICPDGYVGTLVSVEIGYAYAQQKPIIFSETPEDLGLQAMASEYINLDEIERLKEISPDSLS